MGRFVFPKDHCSNLSMSFFLLNKELLHFHRRKLLMVPLMYKGPLLSKQCNTMTVALISCGFLTRAQVTYAEWTCRTKTCLWKLTASSSCFSAVCSLRFRTCPSRLLQLLFLDHSRSEKTEFTGKETLIRSRFLHELSTE